MNENINNIASVKGSISIYKQIFEVLNEAIIIFDPKSEKIIKVNPATEKIYGYSKTELENMTMLEFSTDIENGKVGINKVLKNGYIDNFETIHIRKDGKLINLLGNACLIDYDGEMAILTMNRDVTQLKQEQEAKLELERRFKTIFNNSSIGIYRTTPSGNILLANNAMASIFGYDSLEEFLNANADETYPNTIERVKFLEELKKKDRIVGKKIIGLKKDGTKIYMRENAVCIKDEVGNIKYIDGFIEDISQLIEYENQLIEEKEKAQSAEKVKSEFLTLMTHETRTPLNGILNHLSLIKDEIDDLNCEIPDLYFDSIERSSKRMIRTIDLIMNMSLLHTNSFEICKRNVELIEIINSIAKYEFRKEMERENISYSFNHEMEKAEVLADHQSVEIIFMNLLENAFKFTNEGNISVSLFEKENQIILTIADSGIGMSQEFLSKIFNPFSQEEGGYSRAYDGNGLGLAVINELCTLNNIDIKIQSEKEKGTTFKLIFKKF